MDKGYAYYAGIAGDTWNKKALDFTIEGSEQCIKLLKRQENSLHEAMQFVLKPNTTGFLVRKIQYFTSDPDLEINLPNEDDENFDILSQDIHDALAKGEPTLVLDRLHTFSIKYLREACLKHDLPVDNNGERYPLHSLAGELAKYYEQNRYFESEFCQQTIKMSISIFERYSKIRNDMSYAHDNKILNNAEATYVVTIIAATLRLLRTIEEQS